MSEQSPAPTQSEELVPPVQPKVAKDLAGNFVYYIPDKSEAETSAEGNPPTMKTLVSALDKSLKSTEQVITLSPSKGENSSVVTISAENILGRFDPETLNSLNQLLDEVVENPGTARDLRVQNSTASSQGVAPLSAIPEGQTGGLLPPASCLLPPHKPTQHDISSSSFLGSTTANPISSYDFSIGQCVNSVSQLNSVTNQQDSNIQMSQAHPVVEAFSGASDQIGKELSTSQTVNYNSNIPQPQTVLNQNSFQTKNLEFSIPSSGTTSILGSSTVSENQTVTQQLVLTDQRSSISGNLVNSLQKMPVELGLAQESIGQSQKSLNSLAVSVDQSTALPVDKTTQSTSAFSSYHPVQVYSTPSSQYQQSIMSTPKYLPQIDGSVSTSTYSQNHSNLNPHQSLVSGTQPLVLQSSEGSAPQNMTDQNMNNIQLQNSEVAELYSYMKQISSKTPLSNVLDQRKLLTAKVPSPSRNGFTQNSGLPTPNIPNHRPMYNIPQALPQLQQYSQNYSTSLTQPHYGNMGLSLTPSPAPPTIVSNFEYKSPSNVSSYRGYMSSSTPGFYTPRPQNNTQSYVPGSYPGFITPTPGTPSSNYPRYPPQFYTPRPQNNTQTYPGYAQNGGLMTGVSRSQLPSRPSHPLKLMPKNQMMEVKKTVSKYQPDFSNYPEVCVCEKYDMGTEIHVEQIWLHMNQMYYLPQVQVLAIGSDEFVGILRDDKYYISVREIMIRMVPKFQEEVESYILQGKCDLGTMTIEEFEYLKQRGCIDVEIHQIISLESLRKMCRYLLNVHSELSSDTKKLTEAATGIYYRKILEKHTRCSKCGGAMKCSDILDRYEAIDCPVGITYKEQKMALLQKEVIENALGKKTGSPNRILPQQNLESVKIEKIKIGRLMVGGTQFNTFKIKEKCYISLRELVAYKLLTLQVLQSRLENLACRPRPAPSLVDKYFVKNNIEVHNTLWIDTIIVRCMCCLGQQKTHMPLQKHFKCGDFKEIWDKELECVDDGEGKEVVYTLNPDTVTISNRKHIHKKPAPIPALPSSAATQITLGPGQKVTTKPLTIKMRDLATSERFTTKPAYRTYRLSDRKTVKKKVENGIYGGPVKTQLSDWNIPGKNHVEIFKDVNLASSSYGRSRNNRERTPNNLNPDMEPQNEPPAMTEESILEIAAREAMLMPDDLNDDMDVEYPTSVDSVIQSIGMGDGLPSEECVMQEIERGGLNLFDGVLSASICGDSGSRSQLEESVADQQTEKKSLSDKNTLKEPERFQPRLAPQPDKPPEKRKEGRKKRVPKRFEEYDLGMVQIHRDGYCTTVKHNENLLKKSKDTRNLHVLHAPLFREKVKEPETTQKILNVIKHSEMDSMVEMVSRNAEEAASISPVADDAVEVSSPTDSDDAPVEEEVINDTSNDKILSVPVPETLEHSYSKEQTPEVVDENNVEKLCSPIKRYGNISEPSSPNTSTSSLSEESKSSRFKRACDKVAALESSQDEYRILHMLATVAEVVTESGDEEVPCDQQSVSDDQQVKVSEQRATSVEQSAVCESVKSEVNAVHGPTNSLDQEECANDVPHTENTPTSEREDDRMMSTDQETEPMEEDLIVRDSIIPLNSPVMISDDELLEEDDARTTVSPENVPKLELRGRTLKFIDAVNKYVDVVEIQREPGIITSRIRFLEGAKLAFPGLYGQSGLQRRREFAALLNHILYYQDELDEQSQEESIGKNGHLIRRATRSDSLERASSAKRKKLG